MEDALGGADVGPDTVTWTEARWDTPDVIASWANELHRNLHGVLSGFWPNYRADFEGAVWRDDEASLQRRLRFFGGPYTFLRVTGSAAEADVVIFQREDAMRRITELVSKLNATSADERTELHELQPEPWMAAGPGG
jgi:hypothetical protein